MTESKGPGDQLSPVQPATLEGKPPAFPSFPKRDVDMAWRAAGKEVKRLCSWDQEKTNSVALATLSHSGSKIMCYRAGQSPIPQNPQQSQRGALLMSPETDYPRKKREKQRLNPKLAMFT